MAITKFEITMALDVVDIGGVPADASKLSDAVKEAIEEISKEVMCTGKVVRVTKIEVAPSQVRLKGKWWNHDLEYSRNDSNERMAKAKIQNVIPILAEYQILHLLDIAERGLPDCYETFEDFLTDFWPDFSWNRDSIIEIKSVLGDPRFKKIVPILKETWNVDMVEVLQAGLEFDGVSNDWENN